jgi:hypothetical protein
MAARGVATSTVAGEEITAFVSSLLPPRKPALNMHSGFAALLRGAEQALTCLEEAGDGFRSSMSLLDAKKCTRDIRPRGARPLNA